jgi:hypothetical protein
MRLFSITAPDKLSARDLADGGLALYRPVVSGRGSRWRVKIAAEGNDWPAIEGMVASWLRRCAISETSVEVLGVTTTVIARKAKPVAELALAYRGLPEDSV